MKKMYLCFKTQKHNNILLIAIDMGNFEPKIKTLKRLCVSCWVQYYDAVNNFVNIFPCVDNILVYIMFFYSYNFLNILCGHL